MTQALELLKPAEAWQYLRVSRASFYRLLKAKLIRPTRLRKHSRLVRYTRTELDRFINVRTTVAS